MNDTGPGSRFREELEKLASAVGDLDLPEAVEAVKGTLARLEGRFMRLLVSTVRESAGSPGDNALAPCLDAKDVARLLKLPSAKSVYGLVARGQLKKSGVGRRFRFTPGAVNEFLRGGGHQVESDQKKVVDMRLYTRHTCPVGDEEGGEKKSARPWGEASFEPFG